MGREIFISRLLTFILFCALAPSLPSRPSRAVNETNTVAPLSSDFYDIGTPTLTEIWVSPLGNDANSGLTIYAPLRTLTAAWNKIPATLTTSGYRVNLLPGTYPCEPGEPDNCQNYFSGHAGTYQYPIIFQAYSGPGTVVIRGGFDLNNLSYFYLMDVTLAGGNPLPVNNSGNNLLHLAAMDHVLLRGDTLNGPNCASDTCTNLQEVLKVNQVQYLYVENSAFGGAWHTSVDYFAVQYGHFYNNDLHTAGQWCMYVKGGTAYQRIEANNFHNCQLGFSAGQSADYPLMTSPWIQYEAYDIKFVNNILHDIPGTGLSAAGGYNILFAYNTLYRVGIAPTIGYPLFEAVHGERGCAATTELPYPLNRCNTYNSQGGWGPNFITDSVPSIPDKNVYVYNNIFYNPAPSQTEWSHFDIEEPISRPTGFPNVPNPVTTDDRLAIRGNVIWNGDASMPLGIEDKQVCLPGNPTCNEAQLRADNSINSIEPFLANPATGDYHPIAGWIPSVTTFAIPDFIWDIASVPSGNTSNAVPSDYEGTTRGAVDPPGAFHGPLPPRVLSIQRANANPTNAASVDFTVNFSEPVTGVDASDFQISTSGVSGSVMSGIGGSGSVYTATVNTGTGNGTIRLDLIDDDSILDSQSHPLGGAGTGNGNFTSGETYTVVKSNVAPTDISLSNNSISENQPSGTLIGVLSTSDLNPSDTFTYTFCGGADDNSFSIAGNTLNSAAIFDYEAKNSFSICIRTTDSGSLSFTKSFTIAIIDIPNVELLTPANGANTNSLRPTFDWNNFAGATGYNLQISKNNTFTQLVNNVNLTGLTNSSYIPAANLPPHATLYWRVRASLSASTYSGWSEVRSFQTAILPPGIPILISPANNALIAGPSPLFDWQNSTLPTGATFDHYQIQVATDKTITAPVHDKTITGLSNSQDNSAILSTGTAYYWRVRSFNTAGNYSGWSTVWSLRIKYAAPTLNLPSNGSTVTTLRPTFTWNAAAGAASYTIQVSRNAGFSVLAINKTVTIPNYNAVANLLSRTTYYWRVQVNGTFGPSNWSVIFHFVTP